jgi:hypothetical protein
MAKIVNLTSAAVKLANFSGHLVTIDPSGFTLEYRLKHAFERKCSSDCGDVDIYHILIAAVPKVIVSSETMPDGADGEVTTTLSTLQVASLTVMNEDIWMRTGKYLYLVSVETFNHLLSAGYNHPQFVCVAPLHGEDGFPTTVYKPVSGHNPVNEGGQ